MFLCFRDFRDNVQVLSVGGRAGEGGVHVVPPPPTASSLPSLHPVLEAGSSMSSRDPKRARIGDNHGLPPLRIDTREVKVCILSTNILMNIMK